MNNGRGVLIWIVRISFLASIILGFFFWRNQALNLIPLHILFGTILVVSLWGIGLKALRNGLNKTFIIFTGAWGILAVWFGLAQEKLMLSIGHSIISGIHLVIGIAMVAFSEILTGQIRRSGFFKG
ncbi:MAG: hypothetical protein KGI54_11370 [Pseudomonadota bacterium]|nr:hypothetical protein [Pseudomonadota bacterium]